VPKPEVKPVVKREAVQNQLPSNVLILNPETPRAYMFACASLQQLEMHLNTICPPSICPDNPHIAQRMGYHLTEALKQQQERFQGNGSNTDAE